MATYESLTAAQKAQLDAFMTAYRPLMAHVSQMLAKAQAVIDVYNAGVSGIVTSLDAGATVGDPTGLAGAQPVPKEDIVSAITDLGTVIGAYNTDAKRQSRIKAAGLINVG